MFITPSISSLSLKKDKLKAEKGSNFYEIRNAFEILLKMSAG